MNLLANCLVFLHGPKFWPFPRSGLQKLAGNSIPWAQPVWSHFSSSPSTFLSYICGFTAEQHTKSLWFILPLGTRGSEVYCLQILKIANSSHNRKLILYTIAQSSPSIGHPCEPAAPPDAKAPDSFPYLLFWPSYVCQ